MYSSLRKRALLPLIGATAVVGMLFAAQTASANIIRPAAATPISASMVIAYQPCNAASPAGNIHNPANLPGDACTPPVQYTPRLTAGDPVKNGSAANFKGNVLLKVVNPPAAAATDVLFPTGGPVTGTGTATNLGGNYTQDVRCTPAYAAGNPPVCSGANVLLPAAGGGPSPNPDYSGDLNLVAYIRITDQGNSGVGCPIANPCDQDATIKDLAFAVAADCVNTPTTSIGGFCLSRHASANALCSCVATGKRGNIETGVGTPSATLPAAGGIFAMDGGSDGVVADLVADTDSPAPFARQGLFLP